MSTKNSSSLFLCASLHYSSIPAFHYSILKNVTGWSRVWHGLKTFKRPLLILGCHDVTTWSTLRRGGFLGFSVRLRKSPKGRWYVHREPHPKSCQKFRDAVRELLNHWTLHLPIEDAVQQLNRKVRGWANYFDYGNNAKSLSTDAALRKPAAAPVALAQRCRHAHDQTYTDDQLYCLCNLSTFFHLFPLHRWVNAPPARPP